ncbi:MAG: hypothetical protein S4CHLAM123_12380 [Chlamydiales bacterium]|nr:hypothetical protein [Chlamydiales bacterium]
MAKIIEALERYFYEVLDVQLQIHLWKDQGEIALFLKNFYEFYKITLLKQPCLLMIAKEGTVLTPAVVKKHRKQVLMNWTGCCIYVQEAISSYNRQRLIQHHIPFIAPGNQMYLPDLGIDLREYFRQSKTSQKLFSPATQAVVIYALYHTISEGYTAFELIDKLGYSRMTLIRALNELEAASIGTTNRKGRERFWSFEGDKRELWNQTRSLLRNPIKQRVWIRGKKPKIQAGLSALAERSMLSPPSIPVYAISAENWKNWKKIGVELLPISEGATAELEIWHYAPNLFTEEDSVDPCSLYLSLEEIEDERTEMALQEMMEKMEW